MEKIDLMRQVLEQKLIQDLLKQVPEERKDEAMNMLKDIIEGVQGQLNNAMPSLSAISPTQMEKILRDQAK